MIPKERVTLVGHIRAVTIGNTLGPATDALNQSQQLIPRHPLNVSQISKTVQHVHSKAPIRMNKANLVNIDKENNLR